MSVGRHNEGQPYLVSVALVYYHRACLSDVKHRPAIEGHRAVLVVFTEHSLRFSWQQSLTYYNIIFVMLLLLIRAAIESRHLKKHYPAYGPRLWYLELCGRML